MATEKDMTNAQAKLIGRFCSRCRCHKRDAGATLQAGSGRTRWVCTTCAGIIRAHKAWHGKV
jgi:hypothetical protein